MNRFPIKTEAQMKRDNGPLVLVPIVGFFVVIFAVGVMFNG